MKTKVRYVIISIRHEQVEILSKKHDGSHHRRWLENVLVFADKHKLIGYNAYTPVVDRDFREWKTDTKAIFYFPRSHWFNVIIMLTEPHYYYCNISSPVTYKDKTLEYIDYDIDVIVQANLSYKVVDEAEFLQNKRRYQYSEDVVYHVKQSVEQLRNMIERNEDPFNQSFVDYWLKKLFPKRR